MTGLTRSQWRALWANAAAAAVPMVGYAVLNQSAIEAHYPDAKWLPLLFPVVTTWYNSLQRSVTSKRSGTGTGAVNSGPDPMAVQAAAPSPDVSPVVTAATSLLMDEAEQAIVEAFRDTVNAKKQDTAQATIASIKAPDTATRPFLPTAEELAAAHKEIQQQAAVKEPVTMATLPATGSASITTPNTGTPLMMNTAATEQMPPMVSLITSGTPGPAAEPVYPAGEGA